MPKLVRPVNFPVGTPGVGIAYIKVNQVELAVINLQRVRLWWRLKIHLPPIAND